MLASLKKSHKQFIVPKGFCQAFKDTQGNSMNVLEQMDVDEFFNNFMDKLENLIKVLIQKKIKKILFFYL